MNPLTTHIPVAPWAFFRDTAGRAVRSIRTVHMRRWLVGMGIALLLWATCLRPAPAAKPLFPASELPVPRLHVHIDTKNSRVTVQPVDSALKYFSPGILYFAVIDVLEKEMSQQDRKRARPVTLAMDPVDLGQRWRDALAQELDLTHLASEVVVDHNPLPTQFRARIGQLPAQPRVLRLLPLVWFDPDFKELHTVIAWSWSELQVWENANGRQVRHRLLRTGEVVHVQPFPAALNSARSERKRVQVWLDQGVPQLTAWIEQGIHETVRMLAYDLTLPQWEAKGEKLRSPLGRNVGRVVRQSGTTTWARKGPTLTAIPKP